MKNSQKFELRKYIGDLNAICGWKEYSFADGPATGVRAIDFKNGKNLELTVLADRGFGIPYLSYKGRNMGFTSKVGIRHPALYREEGVRGFLKQFDAGMLTPCGLTYAGAPTEDGRALGLHGPLSNLPVGRVSVREDAEGDDVVFRLEGQAREACVFEENMVIDRSITVETERDVVRIHDVVENQGYRTEPLMVIYHINFGYPMLDAGTKIYTSATRVEPRDDLAREGLDKYTLMEEPGISRDEQCYFHTGHPEDAFGMVYNEKLGIAAIVHFNGKALPFFCQWKCMRAGDYALGMEPTTSGVCSRVDARESGLLKYVEPGEKYELDVALEFTDDPAVIEAYKAKATNPIF